LLGQFNYGRRGILDRTHARLFTRNAFVRLLKEAGFVIAREKGVPPPFELALGRGRLGSALDRFGQMLADFWMRMFAFQILIEAKAQPTLDWLLDHAKTSSATRREEIRGGPSPNADRAPG